MFRQEIKTWVSLAILGGALLLLFAPLLIGEKFLFWGLPALQFYPWREFAFDELQAGRLPFWNPYNGGGAPLLANYQSAIFYPPNYLYLLVDYPTAMNWLAVLHVFWSGLGMWLFAGRLRLLPLGRGISTLSFALAGYSLARLGSFPTVNTIAWMPWLFWSLLAVIETRHTLHIGFLSGITAMLLLAGHAQSAYYILLMAGVFCLWALRFWERPRQQLALLGRLALGVFLGLGIAAVQLLFTAELLSQSQRSGGVDYETLSNLSFAPLRLINFITPNFFGSPADGSYLTPESGVYFEDAVYLGLLPLISAWAALWGWVTRRRSFLDSERALHTVPLWTGLALVGTVFATGRYGPVYRWFYDYVPTFDAFREPVRWLILPVFALSVLAGIGIQSWGRGERVLFWSRLAGVGGGAMFILGVSILQFYQADANFIPVLAKAIAAVGGWLAGACLLTLLQPESSQKARWQIAVLVFVALDLVWAAQGLNPTISPRFYRQFSLVEPQGRLYWFADYEEKVKFEDFFVLSDYRPAQREWTRLRTSLLPNLNMLDKVEVLNNFDPLQARYHTRYLELLERQSSNTDQLLQAAGVGQVYGEFQPEGWQALAGEFSSYRAPEPNPTVWIVPEVIWVNSNEAEESALLDENWSPKNSVIIRGDGSTNPFDDSSLAFSEVSFFAVTEETPTQKTYRVVTDGRAFLVLANTWYPGWSVKVDGKTQPLYRANLSFMAVEVPPNGGEITFRYLPSVNLLSLGISLLSFFLMLGLLGWGLVSLRSS